MFLSLFRRQQMIFRALSFWVRSVGVHLVGPFGVFLVATQVLSVALGCIPEELETEGVPGLDAGISTVDAGRRTEFPTDAGLSDAGAKKDAGRGPVVDGGRVDGGVQKKDAGSTQNDSGVFIFTDAGPVLPPLPTTSLQVRVGELSILQLHLSPGLTLRLGESAIVVGPDGTLVLIDVGASRHAEEIFDVVTMLNREVLTPENGFVARREREVDFMVFTHFHGDHVGGAEDLLTGALALEVTQGIVHRGFTDLGGSVNEGDVEFLCNALVSGGLADRNLPLCFAYPAAPCDASSWQNATLPAYPTQNCTLLAGDLRTPSDDDAGTPSFIPLGEGAKMVFLASSAQVSDGQSVHSFPDVIPVVDTNQENARSLVGVIEYGDFRYHFGGDLTGKGTEEAPDVESHVAQYARAHHGDDGVDVTHVHHHAYNTSSNQSFVDWVAPIDGRDRNVIAGINSGYAGAPKAGVVERFTDENRLNEGKFWTTKWARLGSAGPTVVDAEGDVWVQTFSQGEGYFVQAVSKIPVVSGRFWSVRTSSSR